MVLGHTVAIKATQAIVILRIGMSIVGCLSEQCCRIIITRRGEQFHRTPVASLYRILRHDTCSILCMQDSKAKH